MTPLTDLTKEKLIEELESVSHWAKHWRSQFDDYKAYHARYVEEQARNLELAKWACELTVQNFSTRSPEEVELITKTLLKLVLELSTPAVQPPVDLSVGREWPDVTEPLPNATPAN